MPPRPPVQIHAEPTHFPISWPMGLTMLRLLLLPLFLYLLIMDTRQPDPFQHRWWALFVFAIMAATDKLDGYLARKLNQSTKLGAILDPLADKLLVASSVVLLHFPWIAGDDYTIPLWVVATIYLKDLLVALGALAMLIVVGNVTIHARPAGKLSTVLQIALVIATILAPLLPRLGFQFPKIVVQVLWAAVTMIAIIACADYLRQGFKAFFASRRPPLLVHD